MSARQIQRPPSLSHCLGEITNLLVDIEILIHEEKISETNKERIIWHLDKAHHLVGSPVDE